jgi:hypothetical protein
MNRRLMGPRTERLVEGRNAGPATALVRNIGRAACPSSHLARAAPICRAASIRASPPAHGTNVLLHRLKPDVDPSALFGSNLVVRIFLTVLRQTCHGGPSHLGHYKGPTKA